MNHGSDKFADLAQNHTILQGQVGSGLHGVTTGADDRDEMGVCIEPAEYVIGNDQFEQYIYRTQPEGVRSGPGDLDLTVYSLRKWAKLAADGNPTVLLLLYIPPPELVITSPAGDRLQQRSDMFLSKQVAARFIGYMNSQREQMLGLRGRKHTNRPELVDKFGFDTKFAYHAIRLGIQGVEVLTTGKITLPIPASERSWLTDLRNGKHSKDEAVAAMDFYLSALRSVEAGSSLPDRPDFGAINSWLIDEYQAHWDEAL